VCSSDLIAGAAKVSDVRSGRILRVQDSATISDVWGSATISDVRDSATLDASAREARR
jgi:hypothetical protein